MRFRRLAIERQFNYFFRVKERALQLFMKNNKVFQCKKSVNKIQSLLCLGLYWELKHH